MVYFWWYVYAGIQMFVSNNSSDTLWIQIQNSLSGHVSPVIFQFLPNKLRNVFLIHLNESYKCILTQLVRKWIKWPQGFYKVTLCSKILQRLIQIVRVNWRWVDFARNTVECWHCVWMNQCYDVSSQTKNFFPLRFCCRVLNFAPNVLWLEECIFYIHP